MKVPRIQGDELLHPGEHGNIEGVAILLEKAALEQLAGQVQVRCELAGARPSIIDWVAVVCIV